jgi:ABC-type polar amino acid transport system ATPase subunit
MTVAAQFSGGQQQRVALAHRRAAVRIPMS